MAQEFRVAGLPPLPEEERPQTPKRKLLQHLADHHNVDDTKLIAYRDLMVLHGTLHLHQEPADGHAHPERRHSGRAVSERQEIIEALRLMYDEDTEPNLTPSALIQLLMKQADCPKAFRHEDHAAHEHDSFMYGPAWCTGWDDEREEAARESTTE